MVRGRYNKQQVIRRRSQNFDMYKLFTDNILRCQKISQTIGPGCAMIMCEAVVRVEVQS
jgi:hypothetical protein